MLSRAIKISLALIISFFVCTVLRPLFAVHSVEARPSHVQSLNDNEELKRLRDEDQSDRTPPAGKPMDWAVVSPRDKARLKRVKEIYTQGLLQTANDYDCAALILQHGEVPEDFLLAHEFWVVVISKGKNDPGTLYLAAASEDRFLTNIGRPQRFGTQSHSLNNGPIMLYPVDEGVTDELRRLMGGHSLQ